jgi:hypothetical protein
MSCNFEAKKPIMIVIYQENSSPTVHHPFPALKKNHGGCKCKDVREMAAVVTPWLVTQNAGRYQ